MKGEISNNTIIVGDFNTPLTPMESSLGKFKKIEIIPIIFSDHNAVRLDINYRRKNIKNFKIWSLNNMLLNKIITEEIKKEIKIYIEMNENENQ